MGVRLIVTKASCEDIRQMQEALGSYVKVAVDIRRGILAGGGIMHADCEALLLEEGSQQSDIWGANWIPETREVQFEALINIRPRDRNLKMEIESDQIRQRVREIVEKLFGL